MGDTITPSNTQVQLPDPAATGAAAPSANLASDRADLRPENINDAVIRLAGDSQDGIQSAGAFLARLAGRSDHDVMTYMTIPATISGGPSIFQVRMGTGEVLSAGDEADFLVAFYQHSYQDHISFLKDGGVLLYDSDNVTPDLDDKRFVYVGVPITGLTIEALGGTAKDKGKNRGRSSRRATEAWGAEDRRAGKPKDAAGFRWRPARPAERNRTSGRIGIGSPAGSAAR